jgi:hypothetical protein
MSNQELLREGNCSQVHFSSIMKVITIDSCSFKLDTTTLDDEGDTGKHFTLHSASKVVVHHVCVYLPF